MDQEWGQRLVEGGRGTGVPDKALPAIAIRLDRRAPNSFLSSDSLSGKDPLFAAQLYCQMLRASDELVVLSVMYSPKSVLVVSVSEWPSFPENTTHQTKTTL